MKDNSVRAKNNVLFIRHFAFGDVLLTTPFFRLLAQNDSCVQVDLYSKIGSIYLPSTGFRRWLPMEQYSLNETIRKGYTSIYWFNYEFDRSLHILDGYSLSSGLSLKSRSLDWVVLPDEHGRAESLLEGVKRPLVGFLPVCGTQTRGLSPEKTQQLVDVVRERLGATVAVFAERILDVKGCLNLTNQFTSIRDLAAVIAQCDVFITIDTGPFHISQALNIPTVGLFGCTLPELRATRPLSLQSVRFETLPCLGCYHRVPKGQEASPVCVRGDHACMEMISGEVLIQAVARALEQREDNRLMGRIAEYEANRDTRMEKYARDTGDIVAMYKKTILKGELRFDRRWRRKFKAWRES